MLVPAGILVLNAREGGPAFKAGLMGTSRDEYGRLVLVSESLNITLGDIMITPRGRQKRRGSCWGG